MRVALCGLLGALWAGVALASPQAAEPMTLQEAVDTALVHHGSVLVAGKQVAQAESGVTVAQSSYWPQVLADWQYTFTQSRGGRRFTTLGGIPVGVGGSEETHQSTLVASYTLLDSGLRKARLDQARASLQGSADALDLTRVNLSFRVSSDYLALVQAQRTVTLAREQVDQARDHLALVEARIEAGFAAAVDRFPLDADLAQAQLGLVTAESQTGQASITLRNTIGLAAGPPLEGREPPTEPAVAGLPSLEEAIAAANRIRPDVLEAQANVRLAEANLDQARVSTRPVLSLGTTYIIKAEPAPSGTDWVVDAEVSFPLFDASARRAQAQSARENLDVAELQMAQLRKDVEAQVAQARLAVVTAWERIGAAAANVTAARKSLESAEARFKTGLAIPIEVTDAQLTYYNAQVNATTALYDYFTALAALRNAVGLPTLSFEDLREDRILQP